MKLVVREIQHHLSHLEAHHRLAISLLFAAGIFLLLNGHVQRRIQLIVAWDAYALCLLALAWMRIITAQPRAVLRLSTLQPSNRILIFLMVAIAACASLAAVAFLLGMAKGITGWLFVSRIALALITVILSWLLLHTLFALHYAFLFYHEHPDGTAGVIRRGVVFPDGEIEPDYLDFTYFSFVIGMTSQVSDVQINSRHFRRWALLHGIISFAFNTTVLALSINIISGLF